jgi:hypothetical protein
LNATAHLDTQSQMRTARLSRNWVSEVADYRF